MPRYVDYGTVSDIFWTMENETLNGVPFSRVVGDANPMPLAVQLTTILLDQAGVQPNDRVLDIGCGCGRIAAPLTQHVGPDGSYIGVDIVAALVEFGTRHITKTYPNFRFVTLEQSNPSYDALRGKSTSRTIRTLAEAAAPDSIDLCIATSLFTHLDTGMARTTLAAMSRLMASNGRAFVTAFLIDDAARALIRRGRSAFQFAHAYGEGTNAQSLEDPLAALAFDADHFARLLTEQGLYVERALYGSWPGRPHHASGQDILILRKMPDA